MPGTCEDPNQITNCLPKTPDPSTLACLALHNGKPAALPNAAYLVNQQEMKPIVFLVFFFVFTSLAIFGQESKTNSPSKPIPASEAKDHVNAQAIVSGKVVELYRTDKLVRLNLEKPFPNQPFTVVVFSNKTNLFPDLDKLKGKSVEVSGKITEYHEQPQIVLLTTNQLKIVESKPAPDKQ